MHELFFKIDEAIKNVLTASILAAGLDYQVYTGIDNSTNFELPCVVVASVSMTETFTKSENYHVKTPVTMELAPGSYDANAISLRHTLLNTLRAPTIETDLQNATTNLRVDLVDVDNWQRDINEDLWRWSAILNISAALN